MRFKSDVGSSPPPFKRVVMATARWAAFFRKEKMEYKIKVNVSEEDYKSFIFDNIFQKKISFIFAICVFLIGLIFSIVDFIITKKISNYMYALFFIFIFLVFLMLLLPNRLGKIYKSDVLLHEGYSLTISENEIKDETERGSATYKNSEFSKILFGKKIIALYISQQKAILIPRHCFVSKEQEKEIEEFLKHNYVKNDK